MKRELYQVIGAFDSYGDCRWIKVFKLYDGSIAQNYPGHAESFIGASHKRWRWWVKERRLDGPELMHWTPDADEMDRIHRAVDKAINDPAGIPLFSMEGKYPNWKQVV